LLSEQQSLSAENYNSYSPEIQTTWREYMQQEVKTFTNKSNKASASAIQSHESVFLFFIYYCA